MYNIYIYLAYFFAEKYIIEVNTRYIFQWFLYYFNNKVFFYNLPSLPILIIGFLINYVTIITIFS